MLNVRTLFTAAVVLCRGLSVGQQVTVPHHIPVADTIIIQPAKEGAPAVSVQKMTVLDTLVVDSAEQRDMIDLINTIFTKKGKPDTHKTPDKINVSIVPTLGYTLSTGFAIGLSSVTTFYTSSNHKYNESVINAQAFYDSHSQQTFITQSNIWADNDRYKFVTDLRVTKYPDVTYGLGNLTTENNAQDIDFDYVRFYQTFLTRITHSLYAGVGYNLDYHYNITDETTTSGVRSDFQRYGETATFSRSSGFNVTALFDTRPNPVNPLGGAYVNIVLRDNLKTLGSDSRWSTVQIDIRKYFRLSKHSNNVLAFWSYTWLTLYGKQPYLDLPAVGNDTYNNTGRGYAIDRFRGINMLYLEGEYRFGITRNGFLGGVVFSNVQTYPRSVTTNINKFLPAAGSGLRIKINKHSDTNLCIDYGVGTDGSHGVFVNLGEVF